MIPKTSTLYNYRCTILKVVDGDTVHAEVDLGFDVRICMRFRLAGINAPESRTAEGLMTKALLVELLNFTPIIVQTDKDRREKYGRYLGTFINSLGTNVNENLVATGHATIYP